MIVYRFSHSKFAQDLSGTGARLNGGRWNPAGTAVIYTSEYISLALLELLANAGTLEELQMIKLMEIEVPDSTVHEIKTQSLKKNWYHDFDYTQWMGQEILKTAKTLLIRCPSVVVQKEHNYLINPLHPDYKKIKLSNTSDFYFDERLFKQVKFNEH